MAIFNTNFPSTIFSQYFTDEFVGPDQLTNSEKTLSTKFAHKRLKEFSTGRFCARQALTVLGYSSVEILRGADDEPIWPGGVVGSISHTGQLVGAIVGLNTHFKSIGLDIETIGKINPNMWDIAYTPSEQQFLNNYTGDELAFFTTLLFSFKESFYKMQHPLTKTFLEFTDVEVNLRGETFEIRVVKDFEEKTTLPASVPLQYTKHKDQIITFCYLLNNNIANK